MARHPTMAAGPLHWDLPKPLLVPPEPETRKLAGSAGLHALSSRRSCCASQSAPIGSSWPARLPQNCQGILRRADQPRLDGADERVVEEPLGVGADRLRVGARPLELRDQGAALVQEREEPLEERVSLVGRLVVGWRYPGSPPHRAAACCGRPREGRALHRGVRAEPTRRCGRCGRPAGRRSCRRRGSQRGRVEGHRAGATTVKSTVPLSLGRPARDPQVTTWPASSRGFVGMAQRAGVTRATRRVGSAIDYRGRGEESNIQGDTGCLRRAPSRRRVY
jgi:hypothetical protein